MPASYFQSVNPLEVISLVPITTIIWGFLYARKLEPSSPKKMAIGLWSSSFRICGYCNCS